MLKFRKTNCVDTYAIDVKDLPEDLGTALQDYIFELGGEAQMNYVDGDFHFMVDFTAYSPDSTPPEEVRRLIEQEVDEEDYPFRAWSNYQNYVGWRASNILLLDFENYLRRLRYEHAVKYIQANLPLELVADNKVAVYVYQ